MGPVRPTYSSEECVVTHDSMAIQIRDLQRQVSDLTQRLDTAQTHLWKRAWWWLRDGWPMTDWNADRPNRRPWRR